MKRKIKFAAMLLSAVITASCSSMNAIAVDDSYYYYDVKKASDYALTFCGANDGVQKGEYKAYKKYYEPRHNQDYAYDDGGNCTSYISQILYYGGYKMRGTPDVKYSSLGTISTDKWFYYCLEDNWGTENDVWSSTWTHVDKTVIPFLESGIYYYFTKDNYRSASEGRTEDIIKLYKLYDEYKNYLCTFEKGIEFSSDFAEKYNLKRGDIIQVDGMAGRGIQYGHTLYVWCTEPEIRVCSNTDDYFGRKLSEIDDVEGHPYYRIIHTTDHAIQKSTW